ncbi:MAG: sigma-70 family RNA polymerase sigma factor [Candidatus Hydrogenedentota bacterium]|nr:MAG: sigma-70 family RNA polymerase sigma factor [Candidatus Hydrogenedentota bacterium]
MASDGDLIRRFLSGDRAAFDELVIRHRKQVYATACRMVGSPEIAEEISQETFVRAFKGLRSFRHKAGFGTWLYRITMNLCYDELRRHQKEAELVPQPAAGGSADSPHEQLIEKERRVWLERQIGSLPFKQRSVLILRIFRGMSFKDIGRTVGCSTASAKTNYRHAVLKLKSAFVQSGEKL